MEKRTSFFYRLLFYVQFLLPKRQTAEKENPPLKIPIEKKKLILFYTKSVF